MGAKVNNLLSIVKFVNLYVGNQEWNLGMESRNVGKVEIVRVDEGKVKGELVWLRDVLETAYGPWGHHLILQPVMGGVLTRTKHAQKILCLLQPRLPLVKVVTSHLQGHAHCFRDSTLYAGLLSAK